MSMEIDGENGEKQTVYTADEMTAVQTTLQTKEAELTELQKLNATRGEDFKAYSKMSEEEKRVFDANTTNLLKNEEKLRTEITDLSTKLSDREKRDSETAKNTTLATIHLNNAETKKVLEEKYALLSAMPETTPQEIAARANEAAKLAGIVIDPRNPLYTQITGEAPNYKTNAEYVDSPEGKTALEMARAAMGVTPPKQ